MLLPPFWTPLDSGKTLKCVGATVKNQDNKRDADIHHDTFADDNCLPTLVMNGPYKHLLERTEFIEINDEAKELLNTCWWQCPVMRYACARALAGMIIVDKNQALLINCLEVYGRVPSLDAHHERYLLGKNESATSHPDPTVSW